MSKQVKARKGIELAVDHVSIGDEKGEIVYWDRAEWQEDLGLISQIMVAVELALKFGPAVVRRRLGRLPRIRAQRCDVGILVAMPDQTWHLQEVSIRGEGESDELLYQIAAEKLKKEFNRRKIETAAFALYSVRRKE